MKKRDVIILAVSAFLTLGPTAISSWAAEGWAQSGSNWVYYDSNGNKVTDTWKKGADNLWRYLDQTGQMALNSWVDSTYYVDSNGILVSDKWMKLQDSNRYGYDDYTWYYFGSSGKALMDTWKKIDNKWYYFDGNGAMQTGWILDDMYYCGTDGVMKTGWQKLLPPQDDYDENRVTPGDDSDDDKNWYYFSSNGKKYVPEDTGSSDYGTRKIDGVNYCFDTNGAMQTGWRKTGNDDAEYEIEQYKYFGSDGKVRTGWLSMNPPEELNNYDHEVEWFYFSSNGTPKAGPKEGEASTNDLMKINGRTYLFNDKGNPVYGLQKLRIGNSSDTYAAYYFGDRATSSMVKGKLKVEEGDGSTTQFYFSDSGRGYTGVKDSYLYYMGKLQKADEGSRYTVISLPVGSGYTNYVVNTAGKVAKSTTVKNADGVKYKTGSNGTLLKIDDEEPSGKYNEPTEPSWSDH